MYFLTVLEAQSKAKVLPALVSSGAFLLGSQMAVLWTPLLMIVQLYTCLVSLYFPIHLFL